MAESKETKDKTIIEILAEVNTAMCDQYCKYPTLDPPLNDDGTPNDNWLFEDGSPCYTCPLLNII